MFDVEVPIRVGDLVAPQPQHLLPITRQTVITDQRGQWSEDIRVLVELAVLVTDIAVKD